MESAIRFFLVWMQSSVLYCEKANNYLNIKEKKLDIYFRIALIIFQRSLWTEFANMFFSSLPQSKGVFLRLARDLVVCGCSLPYMNNLQKKTKETKGIYQLIVANNELEVLWQRRTKEVLGAWKWRRRSQSPSRMPQRTPAAKFADRKDLTPLDDGRPDKLVPKKSPSSEVILLLKPRLFVNILRF